MNNPKPDPQQSRPPSGIPSSAASQPAIVDQMKHQMLMQQIRDNQNLGMAIIGALIAAVVGGAIWAAVTVFTGWQIGFMAIGIGFLVGWTVRKFGQGVDMTFGVVGALFSLIGCLLGNLLSVIGFLAQEYNENVFEILGSIDFEQALSMLQESFNIMDLLFYGLAVYYGYKYSIRGLTAEEMASVSRK
jgi:hypothetical protein